MGAQAAGIACDWQQLGCLTVQSPSKGVAGLIARAAADGWCWRGAQIGYWRYISIYRHLQRNPDNQLYPLFEYFENWCQDENRHGDFFSAILKSQPQARPRMPCSMHMRLC